MFTWKEQGAWSWVTTLLILDEYYDLINQLFWYLIGSDTGGLSEDYQLIMNTEQGVIYDILCHARKAA